MEQRTVFISYRRDLNRHLARLILTNLRSNGWDVFLDVDSIGSGDFDRIIPKQIGARAHFILIVSQNSLRRCSNPEDWVLREIREAVRLNRNIVPVIDDGADFKLEVSYLPPDVQTTLSTKNGLVVPHAYFDEAMERLRTRFLEASETITIVPITSTEIMEIENRIAATGRDTKKPNSHDLMPDPFDWIEIPGENYSITKYPITNAQFALFKDDGGYTNTEWWSQSGWQERQTQDWKAPRYWHDPKWNGRLQPVVGISWHEAVAFSRWLSRKTNERISLPTEEQWQYAAQGKDSRPFPWGTVWNADRCNNSATKARWNQTSPVTQYDNTGDSHFGVVDMLGNVWEWCMDWNEDKKPLRGGCWRSTMLEIDRQIRRNAVYGFNQWGFRLVRAEK